VEDLSKLKDNLEITGFDVIGLERYVHVFCYVLSGYTVDFFVDFL
jgi:hypothetical protein